MSDTRTSQTLVVLALLLLAGCGPVYEDESVAGYVACLPHGGVEWYEAGFSPNTYAVHCKDGTYVSGEVRK